jgi:isocitrate lyase
MLWLETKLPDLEQAKSFASRIREQYPNKWLVYNLSPSFNWAGHGFTDADLKEFCYELGKAGFVLQLISLAGLHSTAAITCELAKGFNENGMLAYVDLIQRREKAVGTDVLTHQKWSGANYIDGILQSIFLLRVRINDSGVCRKFCDKFCWKGFN